MLETDTTLVIYSWQCRVMMSCASHMISHSTYWRLYSEQRVENVFHMIIAWTLIALSNQNKISWGGWRIFQFSIVQVHFIFLLIEFVLFLYLVKWYHIMFINIVFWLGNDTPSRLFLCSLYFIPYWRLSYILRLSVSYSSHYQKRSAVQGWETMIYTLSLRRPQPNNTNL